MLFEEDDTPLLKEWIVKRLEDISDADSDVLADYVLALLRHEQEEEEVRRLCVEQLTDFLANHTDEFVNDVFTALNKRSYISVNSTLSGASFSHNKPRSPTLEQPAISESTPAKEEATEQAPAMKVQSRSPEAQRNVERGTKRGYYDRDRDGGLGEYQDIYNTRNTKVPRRGMPNARWGRGDMGPAMGGRGMTSHAPPQVHPGILGAATLGMHGVPPMPNGTIPSTMQGMPPTGYPGWDMAAMMQMGWPGVPMGAPGGLPLPKKKGEMCKDYVNQGFCMRGQMCPYEHGENVLVVPNMNNDEYDPNNAQILPPANGRESGRGRGSGPRGRGRGAVRGGRGGRAEFSGTGPNFDRSLSTIVVESIPESHLNEASVREYFSRFGEITSIDLQVPRKLAILKFTDYDSAKAAYDSPEAIFNNRFVKVFWHKGKTGSTAGSEAGDHKPAEPAQPDFDMDEFLKKQAEAQKAHEERQAKKRAIEAQAAELERKQQELQREKELQLALIKRLSAKSKAKTEASGGSTDTAMTAGSPAANSTNGEDGAAKTEDNDVKMNEATTEEDKTRAALKAQLEKLEAEAAALGIQTEEEEDWSSSPFPYRGRGVYRGRAPFRGARGRGRGFRGGFNPYLASRGGFAPRGRGEVGRSKFKTLDLRPKRISISGLSRNDTQGNEAVREFLFSIGAQFQNILPHPTQEDTQVIVFESRRFAETFVAKKSELPAQFLGWKMSWLPNDVKLEGEIETKPQVEHHDEPHDGMTDDHDNHDEHYETSGEKQHEGENGNGNNNQPEETKEHDFDVAEEDEGRWMAE